MKRREVLVTHEGVASEELESSLGVLIWILWSQQNAKSIQDKWYHFEKLTTVGQFIRP